jgi:hypothetical protein
VQYQSWHIAQYAIGYFVQRVQHAAQHNYAIYSQVQCNAKLRGPIPFLNPNTQSNLSDLKRSNKTHPSLVLKKVEAGNRYNTRKRNYVPVADDSYVSLYQAGQGCQMNGVSSVVQTLQTHFVQLLPLFAILVLQHCTVCSTIEL